MNKFRGLSKLKNSMLKLNKNFPGKNLVFSDGNQDATSNDNRRGSWKNRR